MKIKPVTLAVAAGMLVGGLMAAQAQGGGPPDRKDDKGHEQKGRGRGPEPKGPEAKGRERGPEQRPAPPPVQQQRVQQQAQQQAQNQREQQQRNQQRAIGRYSPQANRPPAPQRTRQQAQVWQQNRGWQGQGGWRGASSWQQIKARNWATEHRTWAQRGGYGGYYVPANQFSLYFGSQHPFRLRSRPVIYNGYPRFSYGGYSFLMVDPYPETWGDDWYASDDVYVDYDDYDDGYYLYNRRDPNVRLAITITL